MARKTKRQRQARAGRSKRRLASDQSAPNQSAPAVRPGQQLHLRVLQGAAGAPKSVVLERPVFSETWQNDVAQATANSVFANLSGRLDRARVVDVAGDVMLATSRLVDHLLAQVPEPGIACAPGCDHCCYQSVGVTPVEALAILAYLQESRKPTELAALAGRLSSARETTRGLTSSERFSPEYPCPFLRVEDGRCTIYPVRPLSCRGMNSLDKDDCRARLRDPALRREFLESESGGRIVMEPVRAFHAFSAGLQLALSELFALDMRPLDLTAAIDLLLSNPEQLPDEWLEGKPVLLSALGGDSTGSRAAERISGALSGQGTESKAQRKADQLG